MENPQWHSAQERPERYGEGDTRIVLDLLPPKLADEAFVRLLTEVQWETMSHRGGEVPRLVAVQGSVGGDGSIPIYRHPADTSPPLRPFTPTVGLIRTHLLRALNLPSELTPGNADAPLPLNHVLIQQYRSGADHISEHSDKTVDVVRGSDVVNVSLGAQRTMTLRTKKQRNVSPTATHNPSPPPAPEREKQTIPLPHNSAFIMGLRTNARWLHSVRRDMRPESVKSPAESAEGAFGGVRISLTFRTIGTFLSADSTRIWGQGATGKTRDEARPVSPGGGEGAERLLAAFGEENHRSDFDWDQHYGSGFDVLHLSLSEEQSQRLTTFS